MRIDDYIERMNSASSAEQARALLIKSVEAEGFDGVAYSHISRYQQTGDVQALGVVVTFPETWLDHYVKEGYDAIDPVNYVARFSRRAFSWEEARRFQALSLRQVEVIEESKEAGMACGVSVPLFGPQGEHAILSLSSSTPEAAKAGSLPFLTVMATQFHMVHQTLAEGEPDLPDWVSLTAREREVLVWSSRGKSNWAISQILSISESAVNFHVVNAMQKLGCSSRVVAILKAIRHGLITP
jgi:LuxR family quorum-sensing system transcriptional regulator CciR